MQLEGGVAGEDADDVAELLSDVHAAPVDRVLADGRVVTRAAHLEKYDAAQHIAERLDVPKQDDGIGERRDVLLRHRAAAEQRRSGGAEQARRLLQLEERG